MLYASIPLFLYGLMQVPVAASASLFRPAVGSTWNIYLSKIPNVSKADDKKYHVWDYDMAEAPVSTIQAFQKKGHPVICYFSAGTWEDWRKDKNEFPKASLGNVVGGWPQERWVNVSDPGVRKVMKQRIEQAHSKGCDGIDPDNIDGYENNTGLNLTKADAVNYIEYMAGLAHGLGMSMGLKNGGGIVDQVLNITQWVIVEQCVRYNECDQYQPYIKAGKPVFQIEYNGKKKGCNGPHTKGFSTLIKKLNLASWTRTCS